MLVAASPSPRRGGHAAPHPACAAHPLRRCAVFRRRTGFVDRRCTTASGSRIAHAGSGRRVAQTLRVLFVGNSLIYVNNLPATLRALAAAQAARAITTATFVAPGGTVADRWKDGHAAAALRGQWDAIVLQERGGLLACMVDAEQRAQGECRASERAHRQFASQRSGARTPCCWRPGARTKPGNSSSIARSSSSRRALGHSLPPAASCAPMPRTATSRRFPTRCTRACRRP